MGNQLIHRIHPKFLFVITLIVLILAATFQILNNVFLIARNGTGSETTTIDDKRFFSIKEVLPTPTIISKTPMLLKSSPKNPGVTFIKKSGKTWVWRDDLWLYKASSNETKNVEPYAIQGVVEAVNDREFLIGSIKTLSQVKVKLLEDKGEISRLVTKEGQILSSKTIFPSEVKVGDLVEVYSLRLISENYFSTSQIFVLLPES